MISKRWHLYSYHYTVNVDSVHAPNYSRMSTHLGTDEKAVSWVYVFFFFIFFFFRCMFCDCGVFPMGPMHYSRNPQTFFLDKTFIKNESHAIIHTFKNYFTTMFLVFSFQQNKRYSNTSIFQKIDAFLSMRSNIDTSTHNLIISLT